MQTLFISALQGGIENSPELIVSKDGLLLCSVAERNVEWTWPFIGLTSLRLKDIRVEKKEGSK